ncbi:glycoside hydrolase superfamily [Aspergillus caelatus]|uniref:Glycoside hydrolase superfamily n=1 Tax=Aspergillus caelatus TaxID=61420 RepID=A0A5N7A1U1_9EURO|nr:glycoside hydrolase superfamily [Aspergillus caelatus]KAE8363782.1 glycoside hydrolase superfamily [Aspergillus caelatus]
MTITVREKQWWKEAVIYQIYPASFCDSNGDGIGDLPGIIPKLDYIASLGANVIWISPMYESPQIDMGYDISNYEEVYPPYGTVQDMETLIKETHTRGMRIMLDLVINHTSDQHAWFKESRSSKDSPKRDWYIWRPARYSPTGERLPPNNWRCSFGGGSAWEWDENTEEYFLHVWATEQPDLNWDNPETRTAIYASAMEFWLNRGVDGFRIDTVNMYSKPSEMPDAPITDPKAPYQPAATLYCNGPRMHEFLDEMNVILSRYDAITVGELLYAPDTKCVLDYVSASAGRINMVFQFDAIDVCFGKTHKYETTPKSFTLPDFKAGISRTQELIRDTDGWTTVFLENHDLPRSVTVFTDDRPQFRASGAKLLALLEACLSGTQYIYQGQEIGLVNAPLETYPIENYRDISSHLFVDMVKERYGADNKKELDKAFDALQHLARDHARLPMPWNGEAKYGGFSEVAAKDAKEIKEPWMKPHPLANEINVASQLDNPESVLAFWRHMIHFRQQYPDLFVYGEFKDLSPLDQNLFVFVKEGRHGSTKALVVLNFSTTERIWELPSAIELGVSNEVEMVSIMSTHQGKINKSLLAALEGRVYLVQSQGQHR